MPRPYKDRRPRKLSARVVVVTLVVLLAVVLYRTEALSNDGLTSDDGTGCAVLIARPRLTLPPPDDLRTGHIRVVRVIDGDTLKVERSGKEISVRLIGIDTPEIGRRRVDPHARGWRATIYVFDLIEDDPQVRLEFDKEREDRYGRTLAYVYLPDGRMLNRLLLGRLGGDHAHPAQHTLCRRVCGYHAVKPGQQWPGL